MQFNPEISKLYSSFQMNENELVYSPLWHYTSVNGLMGILGNVQDPKKLSFWFSRSDCLNDASEGTHVLTIAKEVFLTMRTERKICEEFYNLLSSVTLSNDVFINFPVPVEDKNEHRSVLDLVPCYAFICCFSLKEDSLDMWRYYSKEQGGYALKFEPILFDEYKEKFEYDPNQFFIKLNSYNVIYDDEEKKRIIKEVVTQAYQIFQLFSDSEEKKKVLGYVSYVLDLLKFKFKNSCFASEKEFRFVAFLPAKKPSLLENELMPIKYRTQNGIIVPYLELETQSFRLSEIKISPYLIDEAALSTAELFIRHCYSVNDVKISRSELPVRF